MKTPDWSLNMPNLALLSSAQSRSISPENFTGEKGKGAMATEGPCKEAARDLGQGWKISPCIGLAPGETRVIADIEGPGIIQTMWFTGSCARECIFRIYWDGVEYPSVETPLPDFFCSGWQDPTNRQNGKFFPVNSAMIAVNPLHGFNSYWPMPFRKHCKITVENRHEFKHMQLYYQINYALTEVPENAAYFHAQFRRVNPVPYKVEYTLLDGVKGWGHYVGTILNVGINGPDLWWGEGEMKFYIDGDKEFPTICGTGTEDYFGGAWGWGYEQYTTLYMGVNELREPKGGENAQQRFTMYRWHTLDPVRFEEDLRVTIHDLGWRRDGKFYLSRRDDFSSVAVWYQTIPHVKFPELPSRDDCEVI